MYIMCMGKCLIATCWQMHFYVIKDTDWNFEMMERLEWLVYVCERPASQSLWGCWTVNQNVLLLLKDCHCLTIFISFSKWQQINQMCELNGLCHLSFSFKNYQLPEYDFGAVCTSKCHLNEHVYMHYCPRPKKVKLSSISFEKSLYTNLCSRILFFLSH